MGKILGFGDDGDFTIGDLTPDSSSTLQDGQSMTTTHVAANGTTVTHTYSTDSDD